MEDKSREVVMAISNAARYMDPFFKLTAMGTVLLLQYFARMVKERKLKVTEFKDFQKFLKATDGKYDIMNTNPPAGFDGMPNPKKAAVSLFSAARANAGASAELKIPFTVSAEEIDAVAAPDVRVSGFGVLFGGIMLLSLVAAVLTRFKNAAPVMPAIAVLTLLWLYFPETWWARYNPYLYYVPCLIALFIGKNAVSAGLCVLLAANGLISGAAVCNRFTEKTAAARSCFEQIRAVQPVLLRINDFPSHAVWFEEQGIEFELASEPLDAPQIFYQTTKFEPRAGVEK